MSHYRPQFEAALRLFAQVSEAMAARGLSRPILVGGAVVEFYSTSAIATGDFDITTPSQPEFEEELRRLGFEKPGGLGHTPLGWVHPDLALGFEVVASTPMDGHIEPARIRLVEAIGGGRFRIISIEDIIADRMGQYASGTARECLDQARLLYRLNEGLDLTYLDRRIREESFGDHGLEDLKG